MDQTSTLGALLGLGTPPVALAFCDRPPPGTRRVAVAQPASCGYWTLAAAGNVFYTDAADHKHCPVGAHTHGVPLSDEDRAALGGLVSTMVGLGYLDPAEVASIPHREPGFGVAVYGPHGQLPVPAQVVLVRGTARQLMLLAEAAQLAGVAGETPMLGRPTCAVLPQALSSNRSAASFGCVGNRVYTRLTDGEAWFAIPAGALEAILAKLAVVVNANRELESFHEARARELSKNP
jgi:uncharacterized protein (DUF169 family)